MEVEHSIQFPPTKNRFAFKLTFYYKGIQPGYYEIPNFDIGFLDSSQFLTTPIKRVTIINSYFTYYQPHIIVILVLLMTSFLSYRLIFASNKNKDSLLEIQIYHSINRMKIKNKANLPFHLKKQLICYLKKKLRLSQQRITPIWHKGDFSDLQIDDEVKQILSLFWKKCSLDILEDNDLLWLEKTFKTILFYFKDGQYEYRHTNYSRST